MFYKLLGLSFYIGLPPISLFGIDCSDIFNLNFFWNNIYILKNRNIFSSMFSILFALVIATYKMFISSSICDLLYLEFLSFSIFKISSSFLNPA